MAFSLSTPDGPVPHRNHCSGARFPQLQMRGLESCGCFSGILSHGYLYQETTYKEVGPRVVRPVGQTCALLEMLPLLRRHTATRPPVPSQASLATPPQSVLPTSFHPNSSLSCSLMPLNLLKQSSLSSKNCASDSEPDLLLWAELCSPKLHA